MIVYLNGAFVPEDRAQVSVFDRGLLYGDGCFETLRLYNGRPAFWEAHLDRLQQALDTLGIPARIERQAWSQAVDRLVAENALVDGILRIQITRGIGRRGYSPQGATTPTVILSTHASAACAATEAPAWKLITSRHRIDSQFLLNESKSSNKLLQILAKQEADRAGADDALLLNQAGRVTETTSANLFWTTPEGIATPRVEEGLLPGITRGTVIEAANEQGIPCHEVTLSLAELRQQTGLFLTLSSWELVAVSRLDDQAFAPSPHLETLAGAYREKAIASCLPPSE